MCRHANLQLEVDRRSASVARALVGERLRQWGLPDLVGDVELLASELVTNAVLHARTALELTLAVAHGVVEVGVADRAPRLPRPRLLPEETEPAQPPIPWESESGRGLFLVEALADEWGAEKLRSGKQVWFRVAAADGWPYLGSCICGRDHPGAVRLASGVQAVAMAEPWVPDAPSGTDGGW